METNNREVADAIMLARKAILCRDLTAALLSSGGTGQYEEGADQLMETFARNGIQMQLGIGATPYEAAPGEESL